METIHTDKLPPSETARQDASGKSVALQNSSIGDALVKDESGQAKLGKGAPINQATVVEMAAKEITPQERAQVGRLLQNTVEKLSQEGLNSVNVTRALQSLKGAFPSEFSQIQMQNRQAQIDNPQPNPADLKPINQQTIKSWFNGQVLAASVIKTNSDGSATIAIDKQTIDIKPPADSSLKLEAGQRLALSVEKIAGKPVSFSLSQTPEQSAKLLNFVESSANQQRPLPPLLATLDAIVQRISGTPSDASSNPSQTLDAATKSYPEGFVKAVRQLASQIASGQQLSSAEGLKQAVSQSGIFLENNLKITQTNSVDLKSLQQSSKASVAPNQSNQLTNTPVSKPPVSAPPASSSQGPLSQVLEQAQKQSQQLSPRIQQQVQINPQTTQAILQSVNQTESSATLSLKSPPMIPSKTELMTALQNIVQIANKQAPQGASNESKPVLNSRVPSEKTSQNTTEPQTTIENRQKAANIDLKSLAQAVRQIVLETNQGSLSREQVNQLSATSQTAAASQNRPASNIVQVPMSAPASPTTQGINQQNILSSSQLTNLSQSIKSVETTQNQLNQKQINNARPLVQALSQAVLEHFGKQLSSQQIQTLKNPLQTLTALSNAVKTIVQAIESIPSSEFNKRIDHLLQSVKKAVPEVFKTQVAPQPTASTPVHPKTDTPPANAVQQPQTNTSTANKPQTVQNNPTTNIPSQTNMAQFKAAILKQAALSQNMTTPIPANLLASQGAGSINQTTPNQTISSNPQTQPTQSTAPVQTTQTSQPNHAIQTNQSNQSTQSTQTAQSSQPAQTTPAAQTSQPAQSTQAAQTAQPTQNNINPSIPTNSPSTHNPVVTEQLKAIQMLAALVDKQATTQSQANPSSATNNTLISSINQGLREHGEKLLPPQQLNRLAEQPHSTKELSLALRVIEDKLTKQLTIPEAQTKQMIEKVSQSLLQNGEKAGLNQVLAGLKTDPTPDAKSLSLALNQVAQSLSSSTLENHTQIKQMFQNLSQHFLDTQKNQLSPKLLEALGRQPVQTDSLLAAIKTLQSSLAQISNTGQNPSNTFAGQMIQLLGQSILDKGQPILTAETLKTLQSTPKSLAESQTKLSLIEKIVTSSANSSLFKPGQNSLNQFSLPQIQQALAQTFIQHSQNPIPDQLMTQLNKQPLATSPILSILQSLNQGTANGQNQPNLIFNHLLQNIQQSVEKAAAQGKPIQQIQQMSQSQQPLSEVLNQLKNFTQMMEKQRSQTNSSQTTQYSRSFAQAINQVFQQISEQLQNNNQALLNDKQQTFMRSQLTAFSQQMHQLSQGIQQALQANPSQSHVNQQVLQDFRTNIQQLLGVLDQIPKGASQSSSSNPASMPGTAASLGSGLAQQSNALLGQGDSQSFDPGKEVPIATKTKHAQVQVSQQAANFQLSQLATFQQAFVDQLEGVLSRLMTTQAANREQADNNINLALELPFRFQEKSQVLQLKMSSQNREFDDTQGKIWTANLAFELQSLGPIRIYITLDGKAVSMQFWTENPQSQAIFSENFSLLTERLAAAGYQVAQLGSYLGIPEEAQEEIKRNKLGVVDEHV